MTTLRTTTKQPTGNSNQPILERIKPSPIPAIHPVSEHQAKGELHTIYEETKQVLQVPWMGVVTMAFAHYRHFYATLWRGLKPMLSSRQFTDACRELRITTEQCAGELHHHAIEPNLIEAGYAPGEIDEIRELIETFSQGNMPYVIVATIARLLIEGQHLSSRRLTDPNDTVAPESKQRPLQLMEYHHGTADLQSLYNEIKETLGLPFVNTDYRALARWPSYFSLAWSNLQPQISSPSYEVLVTRVHRKAVELARDLPNPGQLTTEQLRDAASKDSALTEIRDVVRLFQFLLPGLVTNIAAFRAQLSPLANTAQDNSL